jgi:Uma2 family endonuclease
MAAEGMARRRWSVAEIEDMTRAGIIAEDERFELIGGEVVPMSPKGARHEWVKRKLNRYFQRVAPASLEIAQETTLHLDDHAFVEPDFCVFRADLDPDLLTGAEVLLAIDVADSSLAYDLGRKISVYAAYGVREVWVVNANTLVTRVHRRLGAEGYAYIADLEADEKLTPILASDLTVAPSDIGLSPLA